MARSSAEKCDFTCQKTSHLFFDTVKELRYNTILYYTIPNTIHRHANGKTAKRQIRHLPSANYDGKTANFGRFFSSL